MRSKRKMFCSVNSITVLVVIILVFTFFISCSNSDTKPAVKGGTFVDSPVSGLSYRTLTLSGTTNPSGVFMYNPGETVTFAIGGLALGSATGKSTVTPLDIIAGASGVTDPRVTNICRLIQTLDEDGDLNNGIKINSKTAAIVSAHAGGINFNQTAAAFSTDPNTIALMAALNLNNAAGFTSTEAGGRLLRSDTDAQAHLLASISERKAITTKFGVVSGYAQDEGTWAWKGIPYAKPPVGTLRWKAPQDPTPWTGVREATYQCSECTQKSIDHFQRPLNAFKGSEDCLYLDIYRPKTDSQNLPVFVWIHGGSNYQNSAKMYNGAALAKRGNIIVVVIQYRLSVLGWLTHPAFRASGTADDQSGNFGTLDHMKALTWVKNNIAAFGGDPDKVTVGGQSAGGHNVMNLLISPKTDVLFQQAFAQSPALVQLMPLKTQATGDTNTNKLIDWLLINDGLAANAAAAVAYRAGMSNSAIQTYLRSKTALKMLQAAIGGIGGPGGTATMPLCTPFMDGHVLPTAGWLPTIHAGNFKKVPLIIGTTQYEYKDLMTLYGSLLKMVTGMPSGPYSWGNLYDVLDGTLTFDQVLPTATDKFTYEQSGLLKSRKWQAECNAIARAIKTNNATNAVYSYLFTWSGGGDPALADFKQIFGVSHAQDIAFFLGESRDVFKGYSFTAANHAGRVALQGAMMDYLLSFVKTGNPNPAGSALPDWTQWSNNTGDPKFIKFDANLNNYLIGMDPAEATEAVVTGEILTVLDGYPSLETLFLLLSIYPY